MKQTTIILLLLSSLLTNVQANLPSAEELLKEYIRIDTTNPPGNEMKAARFLEKIFKQQGIDYQIFDLGNGRANIMASLPGDGALRPIILMHHMDVVPAEKEFWKHDPFAAVVDQGEIYGRGALDIKGKGITDLMVMLRLKEEKVKLHREVIFLGLADEEEGSTGARWLIKNQKSKLEKAQYLIDEGSGVRADDQGKTTQFYVSLGEKSPLWLTFIFKGKPGHGSIPHDDNAVTKAVNAAKVLIKLAKTEPLQVVPGTQKYLELNVKGDYRNFVGFKQDFKTSLKQRTFLQQLALQPELNALLRSTITVTGLQGSDKINTIPNQASIKVDCRLLPGVDKEKFIAKLKAAVGEAEVRVDEYYPARFTSPDSPFLKALAKVAGKVPVVPTLLTSSTDSSLFRELGIDVFGFEAYPLTSSLIEGAHGNNERMPISALNQGIETLYQLMMKLNQP